MVHASGKDILMWWYVIAFVAVFVVLPALTGIVRARIRDQYRSSQSHDMEIYGDQARNRTFGPF
jgi:hypothetical protein